MAFNLTYTFRIIIPLLLLVLPAAHLHGQPPVLKFETINTENGLSQNLVFSITQDDRGFLWFGTDEGLNRFDGYEFEIFQHDESDTNSITDNSVHSLLVDNDSILWIGTASGITRYHQKTERFERLEVNYDDFSKPNGVAVNDMKMDSDGRIWIAYLGSGVDVFDPKTKLFLHYTVHNNDGYRIYNDYVISVAFLPNGDRLFGTRSGIQVIGANGIPLSDIEGVTKYPWLKSVDNSVKVLRVSRDQSSLYVGTEISGFYSVDLTTNTVHNFNTANSALLFNNNVPSIFEDSNGNIWVGGEAVYWFDKTNKKLIPYDESGNIGDVKNKNPILSIFEDRDGNVWFGTFRMGLLKYNPENTKILHFHAGENKGAIGNNNILSFNEDKNGDLWVGTDGGGIYKLQKNLWTFEYPKANKQMSSQVIKCIYRDAQHYFWIGTWDGGMMRYNPLDGSVKIFNPEHKNFSSRHVWDIQGDRHGNLWIGTLRDGLIHFSPGTGKYTSYTNDPIDSTTLVNNDVMCVYVKKDQTLLVGTSNGLSILPEGKSSFVNLYKTQLNATVLAIKEDDAGRIWLGTNGSGIVIVDEGFNVVKTITEKDGLPSSTICAIETDENNNMWISSYNGIARIDQSNFAVHLVPQIAGLQGKEFIPRSSYKNPTGFLAFGGVNGFNFFSPDSLNFERKHNAVAFTSLKINNTEITPLKLFDGREVLQHSITETSDIVLSHKDYSFTLTISPLIFNWQSGINYSYLLEGFDKEWQYGTKRTIHYTNLDPGKYKLRVRTSFDGKQWQKDEAVLNITILSPWWETWWFRTLLVAALSLLLLILYKIRVRFIKRQQEKLESLVILRTQELQQSNQEIQLLLKEVAEKKEQIEEQMGELRQVNEEIVAQRDVLELRGNELERAQHKLKEINSELEILVQKRTAKLSDALRELETFLYRASHDLRGPISSMLGLIGIARLENDPVKYNKLYTGFLQKTVIRLDRTLQKLLQKHTIEKKRVDLEIIDKTTLLLLLDQVVTELPFFRGEDFEVSVDDDLSFTTDRMFLNIILTNLLENAFFYSDQSQNKKVGLTVRQQSHGVQIIVEDYGAGINHEVKDKIFTMFYRGNELSAGNGLGLYLVKNILTKVKGTIEVETEEARYARFTVTLPLGKTAIANVS